MGTKSVPGSSRSAGLERAPAASCIARGISVAVCLAAALLSCANPVEPVNAATTAEVKPERASLESTTKRTIRATGTVQAVRYQLIQTPRISGKSGRLILSAFIPNGATVNEGDPLAEFDQTEQVEAARQARAKFEDLHHQVEQKQAENKAEQAKRGLWWAASAS